MFHALHADTANDLWIKAAQCFCEGGEATRQSSRAGNTRELMNAALTLTNPRQRWIAARTPPMNPAFAIAEVVWILTGRNDSAMLNYFNPTLPKFAGDGPTYHGAYGFRLRKSLGFDQIERAYQALSANPDTRQVTLQIWDSRLDIPDESGAPKSKDIPCNICSLLKVRNGRLEWTQIMRSNDLFRGFPHNVIQFSTLQEVLAGWLNLEPGAYHHYSDSLHLYDLDGDVPSRIEMMDFPQSLDSLAVCKPESDAAFQKLSEFCDLCACPETPGSTVSEFFNTARLPTAHRNLASILAADALRRRKDTNGVNSSLEQCTSNCLRLMFERWIRERP